ncbi:putative E3 ubiquitin-protein ligase RNF144A-A isoform X1 [Dermacentor variabilis]|uniref:putative E3 ubiquitin-protein ligase RNF144A-A isoform X1 n=2 Tax=Dermacentor variabilis TaxID=34621 RepID=UPI003F5CB590
MSGSLLLPLSRSHREAAAKPAGQPAPCPTAMAQQPREKRRSLLRWLVSRSRDRKTPSSGSLPLASLPKSHTYSGACCKEPQHRAQRSLSVYDVLGDPQQPAAPKGATDDASQRPLLALCRLCLTVVPSAALYRMTRCGCYFCLQCTRQYLTVSIRDGNAYIPCPDDKCPSGGVFESSEIEKLVERDVLELYLRCKLNRDVEMDPHQTWCPGPGCESICRVFPPLRDCEASPVHCSKCKLTFCSSCKERWHAYQSCDEFRRQFSEDELANLPGEESGLIKRCPRCRIPIERDEGCAQMMCKRCRHVFCWYCLASLDDDFLLRHYDKGPCKNKLGHSRASVVWHRTQVVGIFAGFGFLLLLASPLLLLAAPCLLCCRCSGCHRCLDPEPTTL